MSAALQFPIVCHTDEDMNGIVGIVTEWFMNKEPFHFNCIAYLEMRCGIHKHMVRSRQHPTIKVIYIAKELKQAAKIIINQLKTHFPASNDEDISDEEEQLDQEGILNHRVVMMCPACGVQFGDQ